MHRRNLLDKLRRHTPFDEQEAESLMRMVSFVRDYPDCFERSLTVGHITGAAWLMDQSFERVLLTHHRKLDMWLQLGGHADGDPDVLAVALREAREESGVPNIEPVSTDIFDVDVHPIPPHGSDPAHDHYDVRFLLTTTGNSICRISDESHDLRWCTADELRAMAVDHSVRRMALKWERWLAER